MNSQIHPIETLITLVKKIHTGPRADGAPYWTHPLRCHNLLLTVWKEASIEAEIAMLFHDTLEDIEDGETIIREALEISQQNSPGLDKLKVLKLVQDLTTPQEIPKAQAICEIEHRFRERRIDRETYLLKSIDMMDNTSDLISFYHNSPDHKEIRNHIKPQRLQKYCGYHAAIKNGLGKQTDSICDELPGYRQALGYVLSAVSKNLEELEIIINHVKTAQKS